MPITISDRTIKSLQGKGREKPYDIRGDDGLALRVMPSGSISFQYIYKLNGKFRRLTLGKYSRSFGLADARAALKRAKAIRDLGRDPAAEKQDEKREVARQAALKAADSTVEELAEKFINQYSKVNKRSWQEDERLLKEVVKKIGSVRAGDVERRHLVKVLDKIAVRAPVVANRTLAVTRRMFNWAAKRGDIEHSPVAGIEAPGGKEKSRERFLTADEIAALWGSLEISGGDASIVNALRFMLVTGQRKGEVLGATWAEIDLKAKWWTLEASRTKNGLPHRIPLTTSALEILKAQGGEDSVGYVFPSPKRRKGDGDVRSALDGLAPNHLLARMRERELLTVDPFTIHDLRRTVASHMGQLGVSRFNQDRVFNHADRSMGGVYDRYQYDQEKRRALDKWDRRLRAITRGEAAKVVSL